MIHVQITYLLGESLSQHHHKQSNQTIRGNVVRFEKTPVGHETFKFKPFSNKYQRPVSFKGFLTGIG